MADGAQAAAEPTRAAGAGPPQGDPGPARGARARLAASSSAEVEMTLLERATEQVEEAGRLLEQLGRVAG